MSHPGPPPPYSATAEAPSASILQSKGELLPASPVSNSLRTLLLVYIHGFYGNDQSFRSFPAHVHDHLSSALSASHQIHTKIYPRYKTYRAIDVARDNLIAWLEPHVSPCTDVILLGHSMGGLLAADVVLKQPQTRHGILGTISLDSPFLGLHPRIVVSGISSLFRPDAQQQQQLFSTPASPADPNYDPPFFNDAPFRERPLLDRVVNFATKHSSEGLFNAMGNHIAHHLEYGGCLADYPGLKARYGSIRALDDAVGGRRVRFVNYYTLSSGRPRAAKGATEEAPPVDEPETEPCHELREIDPVPMDAETALMDEQPGEVEVELPPIPDPPRRPEAPDVSLLDGADARKAEKEFAKLEKEFAKLEKAYAKTLRERDKLVEKQRRMVEKRAERRRKDALKAEKEAEKEERRLEKLERKRVEREEKAEKRLGKFCTLPPSVDGVADRTWVEVYMDGVDEIGAHCGLFGPGEHYDGLVGDVGGRIVSWVNER